MNKQTIQSIFDKHGLLLWPLLLLLLITPFSSTMDLFIAKATFYREWASDSDGHGFFTTPFFDFIYLWGVLPAQLLFFIAAVGLVFSKWVQSLQRYRSIGIVLTLTLCLGAGFITNVLLKECWGRPRPRQIIEFGGNQSFRAYYEPLFGDTREQLKSFPSGHSTCGFYFFCLYFLGRRLNSTRLKQIGILLSILLGGMLSIARIVQGGHFMSDIMISALIMWLTAYFVDYIIFEAPLLANLRKNFFAPNDLCYKQISHQA